MSTSIPLELIQTCELEILKHIRDLCDRNGLTYFLAYGSLIGAVRHQGFIPWDDDVDIHMPREDYLKLAEIMAREQHPYYRLISRETSPKFSHILAKVIDTRTKLRQRTYWSEKVPLGIYVDVFLLDGAGDTPEEAEAAYTEAYLCYRHWERAATIMFPPNKGHRYYFRKWLHNIPEKLKGVRYWMDQHTALCMRKSYYDCEFVAAMGAGSKSPARNVWKRDWFGNGTEVVFCGEFFRVPENWDLILRPEYGDYMQLPPPEKRVSRHSYDLTIPDPTVLEELSELAKTRRQ